MFKGHGLRKANHMPNLRPQEESTLVIQLCRTYGIKILLREQSFLNEIFENREGFCFVWGPFKGH